MTLKPTHQSFCSQLLCFILCCYVFFELNQELWMRQSLYMVRWQGPVCHEFCLLISCILSFRPYQLLPEVLKKHACTLLIDQNLQRHCTVSLRQCSFLVPLSEQGRMAGWLIPGICPEGFCWQTIGRAPWTIGSDEEIHGICWLDLVVNGYSF